MPKTITLSSTALYYIKGAVQNEIMHVRARIGSANEGDTDRDYVEELKKSYQEMVDGTDAPEEEVA